MRAAQTIWRLARVSAWLTLWTGCATRRHPPPPAALSGAPLPSAASAAPSLPPPIARALEQVREQLSISPPRGAVSRLSFGRGRLAQATLDKVVFRDTLDGALVAESKLGAVRAVTEGVDGSLIALGLSGGARLEPRSSKPRPFGHVAFFPGAALYPDREDPSHFYVYYAAEQQLFHYAFEAEVGSFLAIEDRFALAGCVDAPALTRDGAFLCSTTDGIERRAPRGREAHYKLPAGVSAAVRLLPAKRLDEVFSVSKQGEVVRLRLQQGVPVLGRFQLPALPFGAAANAEALAFVLVTAATPGSLRRWSLLVTDFDGRTRFQADLVSKAAQASEDWLRAVTGDKNLAISEFEPLVAVGGADSVGVWDYARGALVFAR